MNSINPMNKQFEDFQKLGQGNVDSLMKLFGEWNKGWQAITAEMTDYTKRSFEDGAQTVEKLMTAKSMEQALEIQTNFAKRSYEDYMQQLSKIGSMYAEFAKEAYRPMETAFQPGR
ncbi:MAG: phasin family protein [Hyphomicrobiaceae bacterium]